MTGGVHGRVVSHRLELSCSSLLLVRIPPGTLDSFMRVSCPASLPNIGGITNVPPPPKKWKNSLLQFKPIYCTLIEEKVLTTDILYNITLSDKFPGIHNSSKDGLFHSDSADGFRTWECGVQCSTHRPCQLLALTE